MAVFLNKDGYVKVEEFTALAREFDKFAKSEQMKPTELYASAKAILKFDIERKKKLGAEMFERKRAVPIKLKRRLPAAGSRMRMVIMLQLYKGWEDTDFADDINKALDAIDAHNAKAEEFITSFKDAARVKRDAAAKQFDKDVEAFLDVLDAAGIDEKKNVAVGTSMMGKTVIVKLPNGGYVAIGKADKERFEKAKNAPPPAAKPAAAKKPVKKAVAAAKKPVTKVAAKPVKKTTRR